MSPGNIWFTSLQLCKSLILSTSQWGSRGKLRDLFQHTEIVEKNEEWTQPRQTRYRALCAEPALLVPQSQASYWTACRKKSHEGNHRKHHTRTCILSKSKISFHGSPPWLLVACSSGFSKAQAYSKCSSWKTKEPFELALLHSVVKNFYASRTKLLDTEKNNEELSHIFVATSSC